jgi:thiamine-monophosphate kinase
MTRRGTRSGEFEMIARYFAPLASAAPLAFGLTDDAALLRARPGRDLVITTDTIIAGVHFLPVDPPRTVAQKLLRVNLSDLAAKGATPRAYLMNCSFPKDVEEDWLAAFAGGLAADQVEYGIVLIGGDTTATPGPMTLSVTAIGDVARGRILRRKGAKAGDGVWVSGNIGDAGLGLRVLKGEELGLSPVLASQIVEHYRVPQPRFALGRKLSGLAHACLDVSDGLLADLGHMCEVSNVGAEIFASGIPISAAARRALAAGTATIGELLTAGDDYELIFAVAAKDETRLGRIVNRSGVKASKIGRIIPGRGVAVRDLEGKEVELARRGYVHF